MNKQDKDEREYQKTRRRLSSQANALGVLVFRHDTLEDIRKKIRKAKRR